MENNETVEETLKREVFEEVGYNVNKIKEKIGIVTEYSIAKEGKNNIFKMISEYYIVEINNKYSEQKLDKYEAELLFKPCWVNIETAYMANKYLIDNKCDLTPWIKRETRVLEIMKENFKG
jgi:8-oxo-dGTP pyrophosphatase MutT (NUDIX family)